MLTEGIVVTGASLSVTCPAAIDGLVGPNPVPYRMTVSPGLAGVVAEGAEENSPLFPSSVLSACVAARYLPSKEKSAGAKLCRLATNGSLLCPLTVTTT